MTRSTYVGYLLVAGGIVIALLSFRFGGGTQRACPGIDSVVYDLLSVHPSGVKITDVELATATIEWYDGCNWRRQSLVPVVVGTAVSLVGVGIARATDRDGSGTDG